MAPNLYFSERRDDVLAVLDRLERLREAARNAKRRTARATIDRFLRWGLGG